ncbi:MAG: chloride channel protein [Chloroflexota bacterium]
MRSIFKPLLDTVKYLNIVRNLPDYFDEEERRLVFQSFVIGVVVWAIVFVLKEAVHVGFETTLHWLEEAPTPFLVFVPLLIGAVLVAFIANTNSSKIHYKDADGHIHELLDVEGDGLERTISLYYASESSFEQALKGQEGVEARWELPTFSLAVRKFVATLITLGSGGSGGLEASVTLIGESVSSGLFKPWSVVSQAQERNKYVNRILRWWQPDNPDDLQTAQLSGIAAAVAVLLGAPFAAAFFATEVMYRQRPLIEKLVYSLISALVAFFLTDIFTDGHTAIFEVENRIVPPSSGRYFGALLILGVLISLVSIYFGRLRKSFDETFHHRQPNIWRRHLTGAAVTATVAVIVYYVVRFLVPQTEGQEINGLELVLGPGEGVINAALAGELTMAIALIALIAKIVATLATVGSGGSAGLLVPSLFFSTMVATAVSQFFPELHPMTLIIPAMTASLASIVNVPLAAILFTVELYGTQYMVPAILMLIVTTVFAHDNTIYRTQRERYSGRQIMPGVSSRRVLVPAQWVGKTLIELDFRNRFELNVIGFMERRNETGLPQVHVGMSAENILEEGDVLVVLGEDEKLDAVEQHIKALYFEPAQTEESETAPTAEPADEPQPDSQESDADDSSSSPNAEEVE